MALDIYAKKKVLNLSIEDLKSEISEAVKLEIQKALTKSPSETPMFELLTRAESAAILGVSLATLDTWKRTGKIKGYRIASRVRFKKNELEAALLAIQTKSNLENQEDV